MRQLTTRSNLATQRTRLWKDQGGLCFWCFKPLLESEMVVDHVVPGVYCISDRKSNLVGSCAACNLIKSSKMFNNEMEVRDYVEETRIRKEKMSRMRRNVCGKTRMAKVLPAKMCVATLGEDTSTNSDSRCAEGFRRCLIGMCCSECVVNV